MKKNLNENTESNYLKYPIDFLTKTFDTTKLSLDDVQHIIHAIIDYSDHVFETAPIEKFLEKYSDNQILNKLDLNSIVRYLTSIGYFVADDDEDAIDKLRGQIIPMPEYPNGLYRRECIDLFVETVNRKGWDFVYAMLESEKIL